MQIYFLLISQAECLLVNPWGTVCGPLIDSLREPQTDLSLGTLNRVTSVADVSPYKTKRKQNGRMDSLKIM